MSSVYQINKGVNRPIEFRGLKGQYITYLAVGLVALLLLFMTLYMAAVPIYVDMGIVGSCGYFLFSVTSRLSSKYGRYGLLRKSTYHRVPAAILCNSRKMFFEISKCEQDDCGVDRGSATSADRRDVAGSREKSACKKAGGTNARAQGRAGSDNQQKR